MTKRFIYDGMYIRDLHNKIPSILSDNDEQIDKYLTELNNLQQEVNEQDKKIRELTKENKRLKSDLARVIEQASKNDKFLRSDIKILENALWCPNCANDIKRLKELRKEFKE